ncbi:putative isoflavone reductase family protein [Diaporthe ampelina]|uniref:Putative isoflavone reductase family protein n=1 Tax=Diaporthe ampelina TaxID=1214573 RepID=A0A0G2I980_9PEZI|nr:putative isoflavone reductase family protein [Diaporthe ampelina]
MDATAQNKTCEKPEESAAPEQAAASGNNISNQTLEVEDYSVFSDSLRTYLTYLLGFIIILSTLTATIYFPLIPMLSSRFSVSIQAINLTVTLYAVCQAISPPMFASLADCYGRRPILLLLIAIYACASLGLSLNRSSYGLLLGMRAVQSIGGSATPAIAYGVVADVAVVSERGRMLGPMLSFCNGISAVGPVVGGAVAQSTGAHVWVFVALLALAVICFLLTWLTLPETARAIVGDGSGPAHGLWKAWTGGFVKPMIYDEVFRYNDFQIGLTFLPGLAGMTLGGIAAGKLMDRNFAKAARRKNITLDRKKAEDLNEFPIEDARYRHITYFIAFEVVLVIGSSTSYASGQVMRCGLSAASAAILDPLTRAVGRGWYFTIFGLFVGLSGIVSVNTSRAKGMEWRQKR